ncbi:MAG: DUF4147 domain-containing protein [Gammaproteobacteria bacterium]|nr:MAG: DUF4147 domain-containing protein [Gammaproteobacteria bacterium]
MPSEDLRRSLLMRLYAAGLDAVRGDEAVQRALAPTGEAPVAVLGLGKAATAMARGALARLGTRVASMLLVTRFGHAGDAPDGVEVIESAHPVPDPSSLRAGARVRDWLMQRREPELLVLLSGGTSALVEHLPEGVDLSTLQALNRWLLGSGMPIGEMNRFRAALSCIKAGGLLGSVPKGMQVRVLLISDVPGDDPRLIGSGPFHPWPEPPDPDPATLPPQLRAGWRTCPKPVRPVPEHRIVASGRHALDAMEALGRAEGLTVHRHEFVQGDAAEAGRRMAEWLRDEAPSGLHLWHGEPTVQLPEHPGQGGRCQHLALSAAVVLEGHNDVLLLAAATDGGDGSSSDAGALVDGATIARGRAEGLDPLHALQTADSGRFLAASGDLVNTGPTGTNVMDLFIALKS